MATTRLYLDTRRRRRDGTCHLKLMLNKDSHTALVGLSVFLLPEHWNSTTCRVVGRSDRTFLNTYITHRKQEVDEVLLRLAMEHRLRPMTVYELKEAVDNELDPVEPTQDTSRLLLPYIEDFTQSRRTQGTRNTYRTLQHHLVAFCGEDVHSLCFDDITRDWLARFDAFLRERGLVQNSRTAVLCRLRTAMLSALDSGLTDNNPFRHFKMRTEETRHRSLTIEQLRTIVSMPLQGEMETARDLFLLVFYLCGINTADLYALREVTNGRVEYRRAKTGKLYSVKVEPEALAIIDKYRGTDHLLAPCEGYVNNCTFNSVLNKRLHRILPCLSTYWARHTWATIAASLDIPKETIAGALGHNIGSPVTSIYIRFDERKIDEANRKVIDYVLKKRPQGA